MEVQANDTIRGYDFKPAIGRGDCYVEGTVEDAHNTEMGYQAYKITCTRDVFGGQETAGEHSRVGKTVFVPWRADFLEFDGRVINLSR